MKIIKIGIICVLLSGCSAKFDSFDPTTSALRWVITSNKN
jgi:hypothetical protein